MAFDFVAGCIGGCAGVLVGHPLDTVKVRLQTQNFKNPTYNGAWHCFRTIVKTESARGLYKGVTSPLAGLALINAIVFGVYGNVQRHYDGSFGSHFIAGGCAGLLQTFIASPMELAKIRLQVERGPNKEGSLDCLVKIWKQHGIRGVFKGFNVTALREVPAYAVYFYTYELLLAGGKEASTYAMMLAGGGAGTASWIAVYPVDVIKTRLQSDGMHGQPLQYRNALHCLQKSIRTDGYQSLTRGLFSTCVRAFPVNAVTFTVVTWLMRVPDLFAQHQQQKSQYTLARQHSFIDILSNSVHLFEDSVTMNCY